MKLFEPITIKGMTLKNRIFFPPMGVEVGLRNPRARAYYVERAKGGAGAICFGASMVNVFASDAAWGRFGGLGDFIQGLHPYTEAVREAGAKVGIQLAHTNRFSVRGVRDQVSDYIAPSVRTEPLPTRHPLLVGKEEMRALTVEEAESIISMFGKGAAGVREAGFDFVELHLAHGHFPCQWFSPTDNRRTDEFGGDTKGRMRFGLECARAMRSALGDDYPLFCRLGVESEGPDGLTIEECIEFALELEKAGVDVLDISCAKPGYRGDSAICPTPDFTVGTYVPLAHAIKQKVQVPVIAVGRINTPQVAESILIQGMADLIAIGRQLIADPFWPHKVASGQYDEIVPCLSCNTCLDTSYLSEVDSADGKKSYLQCAVNASAGREWDEEIRTTPAQNKKGVLVIGGGPAGMEAALVAAERGHEVTLVEKKNVLGGQMRIASAGPYKQEVSSFMDYLIAQLDKKGIKVEKGQEVIAEYVQKQNPDAVIIATGARPIIPDIPGISGDNVVTAEDVLTGREKVTSDKVIVIGGGMVGCEAAEFLRQQGKIVTIVEMLDQLGKDIGLSTRTGVIWRLWKSGILMEVNAKAARVTDRGVVIVKDGEEHVVDADTVVLAVGYKADNELAITLQGKVNELYTIGDCVEPGKIVSAINTGATIGRQI